MRIETLPVDRLSHLRAGDHLAHQFPSADRLARIVVDFAKAGIDRGEAVVLILTPDHLATIQRRMMLAGLSPERVVPGQLLVDDAEAVLSKLVTEADEVDQEALERYVGDLLSLARTPSRHAVRIYSEVALLAHQNGRFDAALDLEQRADQLAEQLEVAVLCGYMDHGFVGPPLSQDLIEQHQHVYRESSKERLIQAATRLFASGYEAATTSAIARLAGSSESQIVKHFGSKESLLRAVLDNWWQDLLQRIDAIRGSSDSPPKLLDMIMNCMLEQFRFEPAVGRLMLLEGWRFQTTGDGPIMTEGFLLFRQRLDTVLEAASEQGQIRGELSPQIVRDALVGAAEGLVRNLLTAEYDEGDVAYCFDKVRQALHTLTDSMVAPSRA